jgi:phenylpyruvate tautomerase PptA (4-oxalocrotonate tautomerase family)
MPVVSITLLPGYDADTQDRLLTRLTRATRSVISSPPAGTTVYIQEASAYRRDGRTMSTGRQARPEASGLVREFLQKMEARDLAGASAFLAPDFTMHFPGAAPMHRLEELVAWSKPRYQRVGKRYERFDESWDDEATIVYCFGTLHGLGLDGTPFDGIRFIDRFEVVDGLFRRQDVWNDMGEVRGRVGADASGQPPR